MNISTTSLLNILAPKLNSVIKEKLDTLSKDGKVDIQTALKDKTIQTVLSNLFKDLIDGVKTKNTTQELLNNNRNLFDLKTISTDLKTVLKDIESNPKLEKQTTILKEFLVNIKNLDETVLKNNIKNSGIFLESKIAKPEQVLPKNIFSDLLVSIKQLQTKPSDTALLNNIKTILTNISTQITNEQIKNKEIVDVSKDIPKEILKELPKDIEKIVTQIKTIENTPKQEIQTHTVKNLKMDIVSLESKVVANNVLNILNPIVLNNTTANITNDLKAVLLQIDEFIKNDNSKEELPKELKPIIEKLLTQVEFYQLYSYSANSNISYLPFTWDNIEDGEIKFDQKKNNEFSCQINLTLKNFGELKTLLQLDDKNNLMINMAVESTLLKDKIQNNLQILRTNINSIGLKIEALNIFDMINSENKSYQQKAYESNSYIDLGLDIKV